MEDFKYIVLSFFPTGLVFLAVITAYFILRRDPRVKYHLRQLGGPKSLPVLGNARQLMLPHTELLGQSGKWFEEFGSTFSLWAGNISAYAVTCDPNVVEKVISGSTYLDKGKYDNNLLCNWLGTGLLTAPGSKWSGRRKMLTPSFHFKILEDFMPIFNEQASIFLNCLEQNNCCNGHVFNMYPYITKCTLDIICETAMGKKIDAQISDSNKKYFDAVTGMCALLMDKSLKPWLRVPLIYKMTSNYVKEKNYLRILNGFTETVIQGRKAEGRRNNDKENKLSSIVPKSENTLDLYGKQRKVFLDLLLDVAEETGKLNDADIREEVDTFMFEGHDTTAVNLAWTILLLAIHPKHQQLVHKELDEIFADNPTRDVTTADISKMKYLECCIKESLRMMPSVPIITRQVNSDLQLDDGRIIPKGCTIMISVFYLHRQEEYFPEPDKFHPERWSSESSTSNKRHRYAYIPFSAGPRNCIGQKFAIMEEKVVLAKLFRKYTVKTNETMESLVLLPDIVLKSVNGVLVSLTKR